MLFYPNTSTFIYCFSFLAFESFPFYLPPSLRKLSANSPIFPMTASGDAGQHIISNTCHIQLFSIENVLKCPVAISFSFHARLIEKVPVRNFTRHKLSGHKHYVIRFNTFLLYNFYFIISSVFWTKFNTL